MDDKDLQKFNGFIPVAVYSQPIVEISNMCDELLVVVLADGTTHTLKPM
jgi:hypothetical protein